MGVGYLQKKSKLEKLRYSSSRNTINTLKYISRYIGTIFSDNCAETFNCLIVKETKDLDRDTVHTIWSISGIIPGGGGGTLRYRGGPHPRYIFCGRRGLF